MTSARFTTLFSLAMLVSTACASLVLVQESTHMRNVQLDVVNNVGSVGLTASTLFQSTPVTGRATLLASGELVHGRGADNRLYLMLPTSRLPQPIAGKENDVGTGQDGIGTNARVGTYSDGVMDSTGDVLYTDSEFHTIRRIQIDTTNPQGPARVTTVVGESGCPGTGAGVGSNSLMTSPRLIVRKSDTSYFVMTANGLFHVAVDKSVADAWVGTTTFLVTVPNFVSDMALSKDGNTLYFLIGTKIQKYDVSALAVNGLITDFVGKGTVVQTDTVVTTPTVGPLDLVFQATRIAVHPVSGNMLAFRTCQTSSVILSITPAGVVTLVSGDPGAAGCFLAIPPPPTDGGDGAPDGDDEGGSSSSPPPSPYTCPSPPVVERRRAPESAMAVFAASSALGEAAVMVRDVTDGDATTAKFTSTNGLIIATKLCNIFVNPLTQSTKLSCLDGGSDVKASIVVKEGTTITSTATTTITQLLSVPLNGAYNVKGSASTRPEITVQGECNIDGTIILDGGGMTVQQIALKPTATYQVTLGNTLNIIKALQSADLGDATLVVCIPVGFTFGPGDSQTVITFASFINKFKNVFVVAKRSRSAARSLLQATGAAVSCTGTGCAAIGLAPPGADDDDEVPLVVALAICGVLLFLVLVGAVFVLAKKYDASTKDKIVAAAAARTDTYSSSYPVDGPPSAFGFEADSYSYSY